MKQLTYRPTPKMIIIFFLLKNSNQLSCRLHQWFAPKMAADHKKQCHHSSELKRECHKIVKTGTGSPHWHLTMLYLCPQVKTQLGAFSVRADNLHGEQSMRHQWRVQSELLGSSRHSAVKQKKKKSLRHHVIYCLEDRDLC